MLSVRPGHVGNNRDADGDDYTGEDDFDENVEVTMTA